MKKFLALSVSAVMAVSLLAGCGSEKTSATAAEGAEVTEATETDESAETEETAEKTETTEEGRTFTVGFDAEFPPYGYMDENGEYTGFDLELAQEVCDRNGWELVKQPIDWDSKDMELSSGSIDCIWNGFTMNGREDDYTWSEPYVDNSQVIIVKKDSGITDLTGLSGKVVLVQADSAALTALQSDDLKAVTDSFAELTQVADYNSALMTLESGAADAVALDKVVADYYIQDKADTFVVLDEALSTEQYGIGFKKGNEALRDAVQATLKEMVKDGTFETIAEKWDQQEVICLTAE